MYITGILQYLIWPIFIIVSLLIINAGLSYYEKKFPVKDEDWGYWTIWLDPSSRPSYFLPPPL